MTKDNSAVSIIELQKYVEKKRLAARRKAGKCWNHTAQCIYDSEAETCTDILRKIRKLTSIHSKEERR